MYKVLKQFQIGAVRYIAGDEFTPKAQTLKAQIELMVKEGLIEPLSAPKLKKETNNMAGTEFAHGVRLLIANDGYTEIRTPSTSVIGMVVTANDANAEFFPLNRCRLVTDVKTALNNAGDTGTLAESLDLINREVNTAVVVVRVEEGADEAATIKNIMGSTADSTGLHALKLANVQVGIEPRLFGIPKFDRDKSVALALDAHSEAQYGFNYKSCSQLNSIEEAILYRKEFSSDCGMLFYGDLLTWNDKLQMPTESLSVAQVLGKRAWLDQKLGWHHSISNQILTRAEGVTKELTYSGINPEGTEANLLNGNGISVFVKGEAGYKTWGNRTTSAPASSNYFEVSTRTGQVIGLTLANLLSDITQDKPMTRPLLELFMLRGNRILSDWQTAGRILGGQIILDPTLNSNDRLMQGKPDWIVEFTPTVPIESPGLKVILTDTYIRNAVGGI